MLGECENVVEGNSDETVDSVRDGGEMSLLAASLSHGKAFVLVLGLRMEIDFDFNDSSLPEVSSFE
jgi:hypothetical protein